jgi:phage terminase large subunit GpA-like protein
MIAGQQPPLLRGFMAALRPPDRRPPWQWCEEHIVVDDTSPMPGPWRARNSPWVKAVMEAAAEAWVRFIAVRCSAQSAKTQTIMNLTCWAISEDPAPALWVMAAKDEVKDFLRDRVLPTWKQCKPVNGQLLNLEGLTAVFASMPFYFTGAGSKSKLQSKPIRWLFLDEVRNYPPGRLEMALKRTRSFRNSKTFLISTPDMAHDDVDAHFKEGSQETWHTVCPRCGKVEPMKFERVRWDKTEHTKPNDRWHFDRLAGTIRMHCTTDGCAQVWRDTPVDRRQVVREGRFVALNSEAPKHKRSFTWNALLPEWVTWRSVVEEFLNAIKAAKSDPPDLEPLKAFYNETLGESWEEALGIVDDYDFLEGRKDDYRFGDAWPEEKVRFMAADKQIQGGEHYWWLIRAFGPFGKSRLVAYGRAETTEQLEQIRLAYNVPLRNSMMDSGFMATAVYRWAMRSKWKVFKGDQVNLYTVSVPDEEKPGKMKTVQRLWNKSEIDPAFGTKPGGRAAVRQKITLYRFADDTTKDFLAEFMRGLVGEWTVPRETAGDYFRQITAESRVAMEDSKGRVVFQWVSRHKQNHLLDCEKMCLVAAVIARQVQGGVVRQSRGVNVRLPAIGDGEKRNTTPGVHPGGSPTGR